MEMFRASSLDEVAEAIRSRVPFTHSSMSAFYTEDEDIQFEEETEFTRTVNEKRRESNAYSVYVVLSNGTPVSADMGYGVLVNQGELSATAAKHRDLAERALRAWYEMERT